MKDEDRLSKSLTFLVVFVAIFQVVVFWGVWETQEMIANQLEGFYIAQGEHEQRVYWLVESLDAQPSGLVTKSLQLTKYEDDTLFLQSALKRFSEAHNYTKNVYDCKHYSRDFFLAISSFGYDVETWIGYNDGDEYRHAFNRVCFDVESITGEVVDYDYNHEWVVQNG